MSSIFFLEIIRISFKEQTTLVTFLYEFLLSFPFCCTFHKQKVADFCPHPQKKKKKKDVLASAVFSDQPLHFCILAWGGNWVHSWLGGYLASLFRNLDFFFILFFFNLNVVNMHDTWSILTKAMFYFKYLLSENVSLLILWNSVKQLCGFFCHKVTASKQKISYILFLCTDVAETIPAQV